MPAGAQPPGAETALALAREFADFASPNNLAVLSRFATGPKRSSSSRALPNKQRHPKRRLRPDQKIAPKLCRQDDVEAGSVTDDHVACVGVDNESIRQVARLQRQVPPDLKVKTKVLSDVDNSLCHA